MPGFAGPQLSRLEKWKAAARLPTLPPRQGTALPLPAARKIDGRHRRAHPSLAPVTWLLSVCCRSSFVAVPMLPGREITLSRFVGLQPSPYRLGTPRRFFRVSDSARGHGRSLLHPTRANPWFAVPAPFIAAHFGGCTPRLFFPRLCRLPGLAIRFSWAVFR